MNGTVFKKEGLELARERHSLTGLKDAALLDALKTVVALSNRVTARLLLHLGEVDQRHLYLAEGCSSMFAYCVEVLHLSESAAYKRIHAARAARRFPLIVDRVAQGELHLSAVRLLAPHLTEDNHRALLDAARHATKRQVEALVAERFPMRATAPPTTLRRVAVAGRDVAAQARPRGHLPSGPLVNDAPSLFGAVQLTDTPRHPAADVAETRPEKVHASPALEATAASPALQTTGASRALHTTAASPAFQATGASPALETTSMPPASATEGIWRLHASLRASTLEKLQQAQALLRHQIPDGDVDSILERALGLLINDVMAKRFGVGRQGRVRGQSKRAARSRHIPREVRRAVIARDGARCTFASAGGRRCGATAFLEFDHLKPWPLGGESSVQNVTVRCRAHNQHAAERIYGTAFMARRRSGGSRKAS